MYRSSVVPLLISLAVPLTAQAQNTPDISGPPPAPSAESETIEDPPAAEAPQPQAPTPAPRPESTTIGAAPTVEPTKVEAATAPQGGRRRSKGRVAVNPSGATGVLRVSAADTVGPETLRVGFGVDFFRVGSFFESGDDHTRVGGTLSFSGSLFDYFEAWLNVRAASNSNASAEPTLLQTLGDLALGVKGFYPIGIVSLGADMQVGFLSGVGDTTFDFGATELQLRALLTTDFLKADSPLPLRLHLNIGYILDNSDNLVGEDDDLSQSERFALGVNGFSRAILGVAVEAPFRYVTPYLEYNVQFPVSPQYLATPGVVAVANPLRTAQVGPPEVVDEPARPAYQRVVPQVITPGVRVTAIPDWTFDLAIEIGITPDDAEGVPAVPPYNLILFASYTIGGDDEGRGVSGPPISVPVIVPEAVEAARDTGTLTGLVTDRETEAPLADAVVRFDRSPPVATAESGRFRSLDMEPGPVQITVSKEGYEPSTGTVDIVADDEPEIAVALQPLVQEGTIRGRVYDEQDQPLADARITIDGPTQKELVTDAAGQFKLEAVEGKYSVRVEKSGFLSKAKTFSLEGGETISADVLLRKRPEKEVVEVKGDRVVLRGKVHFVTGEARLEPDAATLLDSLVDFLVNRPDVKLRIEGHTDNVGGEATNLQLSRERAAAVKAYLTDNGIDGDRLTTEGFGQSRPLAPNLTRRGREQNRRVEFHLER